MPGGFDSGFDPVAFGSTTSGVPSPLIYKMFLQTKEVYMESLIIAGSSAAGTIQPGPSQGVLVHNIEIDMPLDEVGTTTPSVTLSGSITGAYTFNSTVSPGLRFYKDETVTITTTSFGTNYNGIIKYVVYGTQEYYLNSRNMNTVSLPSRLTHKVPVYS